MIAMILQDPMASLNPLFSIYRQVAEPAYYHRSMRGRSLRAARAGAAALGAHPLAGAADARLSAPDERRHAPAHRRRHRAGRRAEADHRRRADHQSRRDDPGAVPRSAEGICSSETGVAIIFVTHNLGIVARMCDRMAVMYAGRIVEHGSVREPVQRAEASLHARAARLDREARQQGAAATRSPASRPISRTCRRAARSTRAAPTRCRTARPRSRRRHASAPDWTARCWLAAAQPAKEAYDRASA